MTAKTSIDRAEDHGLLAENELVLDARGKLHRVGKYRPLGGGPVETWLDCWSDEYAIVLKDDGSIWDGSQDDDSTSLFPLTRVSLIGQGEATCPDGGKCYHECSVPYCFRVEHAEPLSGVFEGNTWPIGAVST